jgi:alpha-ketoglutarate-dependent taurine dioxygenase
MIDVIDCCYSDVINDSAYFADKFLHDGVFGLRGLHATEEEQLNIIVALGDEIGWVPRTADFDRSCLRRYVEDHSHTFDYGEHTGSDLSVNWHLEHVEASLENSTVAGFWNMLKFDCSTDVGATYFKDNSKLVEDLPAEVVKFLRKCVVSDQDIVDRKGHRASINSRQAVERHPFKDAEVIRVCQGYVSLVSFDGRDPSPSEIDELEAHVDTIQAEIMWDLKRRLTWNWQVGDMLVSDLFTMSHAVSGGFKQSERKFLGYFCSHPAIDSASLFQ